MKAFKHKPPSPVPSSSSSSPAPPPPPASASAAELCKLPTLRSLFESEANSQVLEKFSSPPSPHRHPIITTCHASNTAATAMVYPASRCTARSSRRKRNGRGMASSFSASENNNYRHSRALSCGTGNRGLFVPQTLIMNDGAGSSSSSCLSSNRGFMFNLTREASDCSAPDHHRFVNHSETNDSGYGANAVENEDWSSSEDWKLQAQILAAECKLLTAEKELLLQRNCRQDVVEQEGRPEADFRNRNNTPVMAMDSVGSSSEMQFLQVSSSTSSSSGKSVGVDANSFAQEAVKRLHHHGSTSNTSISTLTLSSISNESRIEEEDPTDALQERLQNLLLSSSSSYPMLADSEHDRESMKAVIKDRHHQQQHQTEDSDKLRTIARASMLPSGLRQIQEIPQSRRRTRFICSDLADVSEDCAFIRMQGGAESASSSGRLSYQTLAEEMYCKAAIRQMVEQVQAETEHWSQMQDILQSLQEEMEGLSRERQQWEERAIRAEAEISSLKGTVQEWKCRARSAQEESASLRTERKILRFEMQALKQQHAMMQRSPGLVKDTVVAPSPATNLDHDKRTVVCDEATAADNRRNDDGDASSEAAAQQVVDYPVCESFVHSRNESNRSSVDLGSSQRSFSKNLKKLLDFSSNNSSGGSARSGLFRSQRSGGNQQQQSMKCGGDGQHRDVKQGQVKSYKPIEVPKVLLRNMESMECAMSTEPKERKKARLLSNSNNKENLLLSAWNSHSRQSSKLPTALTDGSGAQMAGGSMQAQDECRSIGVEYEGQSCSAYSSSKSPTPTPMAPASTPSRIPLTEMMIPSF